MKSKKVLILSSYGGYGHIAAADTLIDLLGQEWETKVIYPINDLRFLWNPHGEGFYNFLLSNNLIRFANALKFITPILFREYTLKRAAANISAELLAEKPDIVISVIPFINYPASEAARKLNIP